MQLPGTVQGEQSVLACGCIHASLRREGRLRWGVIFPGQLDRVALFQQYSWEERGGHSSTLLPTCPPTAPLSPPGPGSCVGCECALSPLLLSD